VFVRILESYVDDDWRGRGIVHPALQLVMRDARDGHAAYCRQRLRGVSTGGAIRVRMRVRVARVNDPAL
jgi:hypothetical protein